MTIDDLQEKISQSWLENTSMQTCMLECVEHAVAYSNAKNAALKDETASLRKELEEAKEIMANHRETIIAAQFQYGEERAVRGERRG